MHRYSFEGTGTVATDSVAGADGVVNGTTLKDIGSVDLTGGMNGPYVSLPGRIVSTLGDSATFEVWATWSDTRGDWQRIFDFGTSNAGDGNQGDGVAYLFLTPRAGGSQTLRCAFSTSGIPGEIQLDDNSAGGLSSDVMRHIAVVVDAPAQVMSLFVDGDLVNTETVTTSLAMLDDVNNWLGRSQFAADPAFAGLLHEFRIYGVARTATEIQASFRAGPDTPPTK